MLNNFFQEKTFSKIRKTVRRKFPSRRFPMCLPNEKYVFDFWFDFAVGFDFAEIKLIE